MNSITPTRARTLVIELIKGWHQAIVIVSRRVGAGRSESIAVSLIDILELVVVIDEALESEEVVTVRDPGRKGGCTFDFTTEESSAETGEVEFFITAWGVHEVMVERFAKELGEVTFRQERNSLNQTESL